MCDVLCTLLLHFVTVLKDFLTGKIPDQILSCDCCDTFKLNKCIIIKKYIIYTYIKGFGPQKCQKCHKTGRFTRSTRKNGRNQKCHKLSQPKIGEKFLGKEVFHGFLQDSSEDDQTRKK